MATSAPLYVVLTRHCWMYKTLGWIIDPNPAALGYSLVLWLTSNSRYNNLKSTTQSCMQPSNLLGIDVEKYLFKLQKSIRLLRFEWSHLHSCNYLNSWYLVSIRSWLQVCSLVHDISSSNLAHIFETSCRIWFPNIVRKQSFIFCYFLWSETARFNCL